MYMCVRLYLCMRIYTESISRYAHKYAYAYVRMFLKYTRLYEHIFIRNGFIIWI